MNFVTFGPSELSVIGRWVRLYISYPYSAHCGPFLLLACLFVCFLLLFLFVIGRWLYYRGVRELSVRCSTVH